MNFQKLSTGMIAVTSLIIGALLIFISAVAGNDPKGDIVHWMGSAFLLTPVVMLLRTEFKRKA